jgi:hypothetical protein
VSFLCSFVFTGSYVEITTGIVNALLTALPLVNEHEPEYIGGLLSKVMHGDSVAPSANTGIDKTLTNPAAAIIIASIAVLRIPFLAILCISISMVLVMIIVTDIVK